MVGCSESKHKYPLELNVSFRRTRNKPPPPETIFACCATKTNQRRLYVVILPQPQSVLGFNLGVDLLSYRYIPVFTSLVWPWIKMKSKANKLKKTTSSRLSPFPLVISCRFRSSKINNVRWPRDSQIPEPDLHEPKSREKTNAPE